MRTMIRSIVKGCLLLLLVTGCGSAERTTAETPPPLRNAVSPAPTIAALSARPTPTPAMPVIKPEAAEADATPTPAAIATAPIRGRAIARSNATEKRRSYGSLEDLALKPSDAVRIVSTQEAPQELLESPEMQSFWGDVQPIAGLIQEVTIDGIAATVNFYEFDSEADADAAAWSMEEYLSGAQAVDAYGNPEDQFFLTYGRFVIGVRFGDVVPIPPARFDSGTFMISTRQG